MALKLKACPRCSGDLFWEPIVGAHGMGVWQFTCLQCGHSIEVKAPQVSGFAAANQDRVARAS